MKPPSLNSKLWPFYALQCRFAVKVVSGADTQILYYGSDFDSQDLPPI